MRTKRMRPRPVLRETEAETKKLFEDHAGLETLTSLTHTYASITKQHSLVFANFSNALRMQR